MQCIRTDFTLKQRIFISLFLLHGIHWVGEDPSALNSTAFTYALVPIHMHMLVVNHRCFLRVSVGIGPLMSFDGNRNPPRNNDS